MDFPDPETETDLDTETDTDKDKDVDTDTDNFQLCEFLKKHDSKILSQKKIVAQQGLGFLYVR